MADKPHMAYPRMCYVSLAWSLREGTSALGCLHWTMSLRRVFLWSELGAVIAPKSRLYDIILIDSIQTQAGPEVTSYVITRLLWLEQVVEILAIQLRSV